MDKWLDAFYDLECLEDQEAEGTSVGWELFGRLRSASFTAVYVFLFIEEEKARMWTSTDRLEIENLEEMQEEIRRWAAEFSR